MKGHLQVSFEVIISSLKSHTTNSASDPGNTFKINRLESSSSLSICQDYAIPHGAGRLKRLSRLTKRTAKTIIMIRCILTARSLVARSLTCGRSYNGSAFVSAPARDPLRADDLFPRKGSASRVSCWLYVCRRDCTCLKDQSRPGVDHASTTSCKFNTLVPSTRCPFTTSLYLVGSSASSLAVGLESTGGVVRIRP